jgi:hypothetical protein
MKRKTIVKFEELPIRTSKISTDDEVKIFGGECVKANQWCNAYWTCCENLRCHFYPGARDGYCGRL